MYSPKELEGEVDHSFFDSDGDVDHSKIDKEQGINCERLCERSLTIKETGVKPKEPQTEQNSGTERTSANTRDPSLLGLIPQLATKEGHGFGAEDRSHCSSISSTKSEDGKVIANDIRIASSAEELEEDTDDDEDGYHQSQDESEEESGRQHGPRLIPGLIGTLHSPPKKPVRKLRHRSRSPSSSSSESETDDSCSSGGSCSSESFPSVDMVHTRSPKRSSKPVLSIPQTTVPSSPRRRPPRLGSAAPSKTPQSTTNNMNAMEEEEDDTVTDVTPLSTPDSSPAQSLDLAVVREVLVDAEEFEGPRSVGVRHQQPQKPGGCASSSNLSRISPEEEGGSWDPDVEEAFLNCLEGGLAINCPTRGRNRKNYSFSNEEVRHIDRENQRLLHQLSLRSRPHSTGASSTTSSSLRRSNPPPARLYHSALNRQREQQRIEKENLAFLRRLESVKPTRGMKRAEQLADYQRQAGYLGTATPLSAMDRSQSKMERNSTRMSSGRRARPSSTHHSARASSVTTSNTPLPRHDRADVGRASSS